MGSKFSHEYMFNYTEEFISNYKSHHKFAYLHILPGHESTGSVIKSADMNLKIFLSNSLKFFSENNEDFAIFLMGDHGLHVGAWDKIEEGAVENLLPLAFLVTNKNLVQKIGANEVLTENTGRLVSKLDWNLSLKHLAVVPYGNLKIGSECYKE